MLRNAFAIFAMAAVVGAAFVPDDALAYRGGARAGAVGVRGGAVAGRGVAYRGGAVAGRGVAYRGGAYRGGYYPYRGAAVGAAAVGAAAVGAAAYGAYGSYNNGYGYDNGCYRDAYGNMVCQQY